MADVGERMILIDTWPAALGARHERYRREAIAALNRRDFAAAQAAWTAAVKVLARAQPKGQRYHKGESLHNVGLARLYAGDERGALETTLCAFIEDALSRAEESPLHLDELERPAAHNLVYVFAVPGPVVADLSRWVRRLVASGEVVRDPASLLGRPEVVYVLGTAPATTGKRIPGIFNSPMDRRVFVGGFYGGGLLASVLVPIRDEARAAGFDGVLADDFSIPAGMGTDEHALMLLANCRRAIFDFTERGGQEIEFDRLADTMRDKTLVVYDARVADAPKVSGGMTFPKLARWGITPTPFRDEPELRGIVRTFLT
jgi:hypothetical protein